jgi:hypothetical protein
MTEQAVQPIAQILAIEQHEQDERHHETGRAERLDHRAEPSNRGKSGDRLARHDHRLSRCSGCGPRCSEIALQLRQGRLEFLN